MLILSVRVVENIVFNSHILLEIYVNESQLP
jgi:hypothetical protein